jgi:hypothetical protein
MCARRLRFYPDLLFPKVDVPTAAAAAAAAAAVDEARRLSLFPCLTAKQNKRQKRCSILLLLCRH